MSASLASPRGDGIDTTLEASVSPAPALSATWKAATQPAKVPSLGRTIVEQVQPGGRFRARKGRILEQVLRRDIKQNLY